jgi:hypothetical protein
MILVDQPIALIDQPIAIELRGFPPHQQVRITATQTLPGASRWQGHATFISDGDGRVDLARQAPLAGSYDGAASMGLFWSAEQMPGETQPGPADYALRPIPVRLEATAPDGTRATLTLERQIASPGVTRHPIRTAGIVGTLFSCPPVPVDSLPFSWSAAAAVASNNSAPRSWPRTATRRWRSAFSRSRGGRAAW